MKVGDSTLLPPLRSNLTEKSGKSEALKTEAKMRARASWEISNWKIGNSHAAHTPRDASDLMVERPARIRWRANFPIVSRRRGARGAAYYYLRKLIRAARLFPGVTYSRASRGPVIGDPRYTPGYRARDESNLF